MTFREQQATAKAIEQVLLLATAARRGVPAGHTAEMGEVQRFLDRHQARGRCSSGRCSSSGA
jgi:hypothetical protein